MAFKRQLLPIALLLCTAAAGPGLRAETHSAAQITELVREAVASLTEEEQAAHRFTYFELAHTQNRDEKGRLYYDRTTLTETTYIADLPFDRLVEVDGKPLTGKALLEEQARYDRAVHERSALDASARARLDKQLFINAALPYAQLTTRFRLAEARVEDLRPETPVSHPALVTLVIDATPSSSSDLSLPVESRHIRLWLSQAAPGAPPHLLRADFDYLIPEAITQGRIEPGSRGSILFTVIDGISVPQYKEIHTRVLPAAHAKRIQVDVERTYSLYRRFVSSTRILPVETGTPQ